ncbi:hypothetical protein [Streptomyces sp. NPDC007883]|uniref:hypothetical protein n=1 Tax=Streptomyces sp. NPDC007883 TaxID=3155116 RepID=UPI0033FF520F
MSDVPTRRPRPCRTCGVVLPRNNINFHKDASCADGLKLQCRPCANAEARKRYAAQADKVCQRIRERRIERSEHFAALPVWNAA